MHVRGTQVRAVQEYVRELLEQEEKFLIFAHHQVLLDGIQEVINKCASWLAAWGSLFVNKFGAIAHAPINAILLSMYVLW